MLKSPWVVVNFKYPFLVGLMKTSSTRASFVTTVGMTEEVKALLMAPLLRMEAPPVL